MTQQAAVPIETAPPKLTPQQWKSGIAAWLGWLFDGLDMHLYTLIAAPFVMQLLHAASETDAIVKEKSSWIQASFLVGWALGGAFFGRVGDLVGRSRALSLTVLTYALFTGLSFIAQTWWHLLIFRFLAALGIGGEWAVGSSLLSETWPRRWRAWIAAVLQTGVNIGVLGACLAHYFLASQPPRYVFLVGVVPAFLVFYIRKHVPEPEEWHNARQNTAPPSVRELFRGSVRRTTLLSIVVCACSLSAWWAFMFWYPQHIRNLPDIADWANADKKRLVATVFLVNQVAAIFGNFAAALLSRLVGYKYGIALMCLGFFGAMMGAHIVPRDHTSYAVWVALVGFFSGVFGLFTMYLPPLFPTLLRTTGAGFSYNIGRIAAAIGTVVFGLFSTVGDFRHALLYASFLFLPAMLVALLLPDLRDKLPVGEPVD